MKQYRVKVKETYEKSVVVEADTLWEAENKVREIICGGEVSLTADDYQYTDFTADEVVRRRID